uniref:Uncharacterized protein n=1 Tax=Timema poppense TaxID=170557 RepID=A0A7R9CJN0_TIMPO|nr:unnamed protein product [Timema poppensis]
MVIEESTTGLGEPGSMPGCISGYSTQHDRWEFPISPVEGFKLGQFLDRHQGFEKVSTEESDEEASSNSSSVELGAGQRTQFA